MVDRRGALQHGSLGIGVQFNTGENDLPGLGRLYIPGAVPDIQRQGRAVRSNVKAGTLIDQHDVPVRRPHKKTADLIRGLQHRQHDLPQIPHKSQTLGMKHHHGRRSIVFQTRNLDRYARELIGIVENLAGQGLQGQRIVAHIVKQIVGYVRLKRRGAEH